MSIGERISALRKSANISQGQLAGMLDVTRQAVSKWENDLSSPDTLKLIQLADALNTDVEYLATGRQSEPIVLKSVEYQDRVVEKVIEKPVVKFVEKIVPQVVEKEIEKTVLKRIVRVKYYRNPFEYILFAAVGFFLGFLAGKIL